MSDRRDRVLRTAGQALSAALGIIAVHLASTLQSGRGPGADDLVFYFWVGLQAALTVIASGLWNTFKPVSYDDETAGHLP